MDFIDLKFVIGVLGFIDIVMLVIRLSWDFGVVLNVEFFLFIRLLNRFVVGFIYCNLKEFFLVFVFLG